MQSKISVSRPDKSSRGGVFGFTDHAQYRMALRGVSRDAVHYVLQFGSVEYRRKAWYHRITRRDVLKWLEKGLDLHMHEGIHVLVSADGAVLTAYRTRKKGRLRHSAHASRKLTEMMSSELDLCEGCL